MKCPQCASDLNVKDALALPRFGQMPLALCAFCGGFVALDEDLGSARILEACTSCGAPMNTSAVASAATPARPPSAGEESARARADSRTSAAGPERPADTNPPLECAACRETLPPTRETTDEASERILKDALRAFPPVHGSETTGYFEQILGSVASGAGFDRSALRLAIVADLGFRTVSVPGGVILAGRELLCGLEDEAMLAFVLAREIAHQQSGRVSRRFRQRRSASTLTAGLEWGIGVLTRGTLTVGRTAADLVREVAWLGYGSIHEQQADEWAMKQLGALGYDPAAAVRYLDAMERQHLEARGVLAAFLDVHPARSRRRCLAETMLAIDARSARVRRINREVYRRAAAALRRDDLAARPSRSAPPPEPQA